MSAIIVSILRYVVLAGLVFGAVTFFPQSPVTLNNRLIIAGTVVAVYGLLDLIGDFTPAMRRFVCKHMCDDSNDL